MIYSFDRGITGLASFGLDLTSVSTLPGMRDHAPRFTIFVQVL